MNVIDADALRQPLGTVLAKDKAEKNGNTLGDAQEKTLVELQPYTLAEL